MSGCDADDKGHLRICAGCRRTAESITACCIAVGGNVEHLAMAFVQLAAQNGWTVDYMIGAVRNLAINSDATSPVRFDASGERVTPPPSGLH